MRVLQRLGLDGFGAVKVLVQMSALLVDLVELIVRGLSGGDRRCTGTNGHLDPRARPKRGGPPTAGRLDRQPLLLFRTVSPRSSTF
jgi:hypothetical protein